MAAVCGWRSGALAPRDVVASDRQFGKILPHIRHFLAKTAIKAGRAVAS
jgi:hypothetical protein